MKKVTLFMGLLALTVSVFCQIGKKNYKGNWEVSDIWEIKPYLYNNEYNEVNSVCRWQNYWYMREDDTRELIPDTLVIQFVFNNYYAADIEFYEPLIKDVDYTFKSVIQYKYGDTDYSYTIKNPKISNPIVVIEQKIPLGKITKDANAEFEDIFVVVPIKIRGIN